MLDSTSESLIGSPEMARFSAADIHVLETVAILEELLAQSILLRDLYKNARLQTSDIQFRRLHLVFESHYRDQLHLVDVLIDRVRMLGGTGRVLAGDFLKGTQLCCGPRGRRAPDRWVAELLDAHEQVLNIAQPARSNDKHQWAREFAVGLVVLTNDLQSASLSEQWLPDINRTRVSTYPHRDEWT
jgi:starvation-inducible DNA-binding protein